MDKIVQNIRTKRPLVQCITNEVTMNDCANMILAVGGSPAMADRQEESEDFTRLAQALVINMGNLSRSKVDAMLVSGQLANQLGLPVILDPVAAGVSQYRQELAELLLAKIKFSCIRGNASEIRSLAKLKSGTQGVDAASEDLVKQDNLGEMGQVAQELSRETGAIIVISGALDLISNGVHTYVVENGHEIMSSVTGTGCMLTSLIGAYLGANPSRSLEAVLYATIHMALAGELAHKKMLVEKTGIGSFKTYLFDYSYNLRQENLEEMKQLEKIN